MNMQLVPFFFSEKPSAEIRVRGSSRSRLMKRGYVMTFEMCCSKRGNDTNRAAVVLRDVSFLFCIVIDRRPYRLARVFENSLD